MPVKVSIAKLGNEAKSFVLEDDSTILDAFETAGMKIRKDEEVLTLAGDKVSVSEKATDGETYYLTTKYVSQ